MSARDVIATTLAYISPHGAILADVILADLTAAGWTVAPPGSRVVPEGGADADETISAYEFMAREFDRLAILRKMWNAAEVAATIRRMEIPSPSEDRPALRALAEPKP